jgi:hypothetical protein
MREMDLHVTLDNRIVHVQLHRTVHEELEAHPEYVAKLRTVLNNNLTNACDHSFAEVYETYNSVWLEQLSKFGYELAVVWFDGSWPFGSDFEKELLRLHDTEWNQKRWMLAGHIINRPGQYPKWHHQCVVVNLKSWAEDGYPNPAKFGKKLRAGFRASAECLHDDYTPLELIPDKSVSCSDLKISEDFFNPFIHQALGAGYQVLNFPQSLRDHKCCIYPEDDIEQTLDWLMDVDYMERLSTQEVRQFGFGLNEDKMELYGYKAQKVQVLYVTNTESVPKEAPDVGFTKLAVPCSGLHQFWHIVHALDTVQQVLWFDFNPYAVAWTKLVLSEWDGKNFEKFFEQNIDRVVGDGVISKDCVLFDPELAQAFIDDMGGEQRWMELFARIKTLDHQFCNTDIVKHWDQVAQQIGSDHRLFLQVSNIWQYESNYLNTRPLHAQLAFINLIKTLLENNTELYLTGDTPGGIHYTYQNIKSLTGLF